MGTDDNSKEMGLPQWQTLHRKKHERSFKTGTVSNLVPSTQSNFSQRTQVTKVTLKNYEEISQKVVNTLV